MFLQVYMTTTLSNLLVFINIINLLCSIILSVVLAVPEVVVNCCVSEGWDIVFKTERKLINWIVLLTLFLLHIYLSMILKINNWQKKTAKNLLYSFKKLTPIVRSNLTDVSEILKCDNKQKFPCLVEVLWMSKCYR